MYAVIDEAFVKETIGRYDELTKQIHNEVVRVCKSLTQRMDEREKDYMIEAAGMPGKPDGFCISAVGIPSDLYEVYERYRELMREQTKEAMIYLTELTSKQETMNRIMICVQILPQEERDVIMKLYGPGQYYCKGKLEAINEMGMASTTLDRTRRKAIRHIMDIYSLDYSSRELYSYDIETHSLRSYR